MALNRYILILRMKQHKNKQIQKIQIKQTTKF